jgi:DNA-directed RNA polymerase specialized sigma24 family protein
MDDVLLLSRLARGDERALAELYQRHSAKVYALGLRMLSSKEEAEEMLQDTFYKLYKKAARFRGFAPQQRLRELLRQYSSSGQHRDDLRSEPDRLHQ